VSETRLSLDIILPLSVFSFCTRVPLDVLFPPLPPRRRCACYVWYCATVQRKAMRPTIAHRAGKKLLFRPRKGHSWAPPRAYTHTRPGPDVGSGFFSFSFFLFFFFSAAPLANRRKPAQYPFMYSVCSHLIHHPAARAHPPSPLEDSDTANQGKRKKRRRNLERT
jgi:hypothetical protein